MSSPFTRPRTDDEELMYDAGRIDMKHEMLKRLTDYLELARFSEDVEGAEPNAEWLAGFQAAIAILRGENK